MSLAYPTLTPTLKASRDFKRAFEAKIAAKAAEREAQLRCLIEAEVSAPEPPPAPPKPPAIFRRYPEVAAIQKITAKHFGVSYDDLLSHRRTKNIVLPRQVAMYVSKCLRPDSFPTIGRHFSGRDHTTAMHAVRKIERLLPLDSELSMHVETIIALVAWHLQQNNERAAQ